MYISSRFVAAAVATGALATAHAAHGESKAWTAAKASLPATTAVVVNVDVSQVAKSETFQQLFPLAMSANAELKDGLDSFKSVCKLDPMTAVKSVAIGIDAAQDDGAVYVHIPGFTPAKLQTCVQDLAKSKGSTDPITVTTAGGITDLASKGQHVYAAWISGDVLAIVPKHMDDKNALKTWTAGGFAKSPAGGVVTNSKVNTGTAAFVASTIEKDIDGQHHLKKGYGWITLTGGNLGLEFHGDLGDAAVASKLASDSQAQLAQLRQNPPLPQLASLLQAIAISSAGSEVVVKGSVVEKDFATVTKMALGMMLSGANDSKPPPVPVPPPTSAPKTK